MKKFDLGFGESVAVREAFLETAKRTPIVFTQEEMGEMGYPDHSGDPELIKLTRQVIKRQTGNDYSYIYITNGATGALNVTLRALKNFGVADTCVTREAPYFRYYPDIVKYSGMNHVNTPPIGVGFVRLIDSPSNPIADFSWYHSVNPQETVIWDSVYHTQSYAPGKHPQPNHDILVGSYSKLTGLNGLRLGWVATNRLFFAVAISSLVNSEYCGISVPSTKIVLETVGKFRKAHWESFEQNAQNRLDYNREQISKLEKFFGGTPVPENGMFYFGPMDSACKRLLTKSNVTWSPGPSLGAANDFGRLNVGQNMHTVRDAVKTVLKNDKC